MIPFWMMGPPDILREARTGHLLFYDDEEDSSSNAGTQSDNQASENEGDTSGGTTAGDGGGNGGESPSNTGFDYKGKYVDPETGQTLYGTAGVGNYDDANDFRDNIFNDFNERRDQYMRDGDSEQRATDRAYKDLEQDLIDDAKAEKQKTQDILGVVGKFALLIGQTEVFAAALIGGLFSQAKEKGIDVDDAWDAFNERMADDSRGPITDDEMADLFGYDSGEEAGDSIQDITSGIDGGTGGGGTTGGPAGNVPEGSLSFGQLPPAYEQYRQDLLGSRMSELQDILPEVFSDTREKGIGAVGGITSVYQDLKQGTERRIGETVKQAQLETSGQALTAYNQGRAVDVDYLKGIKMAEIGGETQTNIAEANLDAEKYAGLGKFGLDLYDILTG